MAGTTKNLVFKITFDPKTGTLKGISKAFNKPAKDIEKRSKKMTSTMSTQFKKLAGIIAGVFAVQAVIEFGKSVADTMIKMDRYQRTMIGIVQNTKMVGKINEFVTSTSDRLGVSYMSQFKSVSKLVAIGKANNYEMGQLMQIYEGITEAGAALNLSSDMLENAFYGVEQMMSKGVIQMEEFKGQLAERMPIALAAMAKALNVTTSEVFELVEAGKLISKDTLPKFAKELSKMVKDVLPAATRSAYAEFTRMKNAWDMLIISIGNSGVLDQIVIIFKKLKAALADPVIQNNIKEFIKDLAHLAEKIVDISMALAKIPLKVLAALAGAAVGFAVAGPAGAAVGFATAYMTAAALSMQSDLDKLDILSEKIELNKKKLLEWKGKFEGKHKRLTVSELAIQASIERMEKEKASLEKVLGIIEKVVVPKSDIERLFGEQDPGGGPVKLGPGREASHELKMYTAASDANKRLRKLTMDTFEFKRSEIQKTYEKEKGIFEKTIKLVKDQYAAIKEAQKTDPTVTMNEETKKEIDSQVAKAKQGLLDIAKARDLGFEKSFAAQKEAAEKEEDLLAWQMEKEFLMEEENAKRINELKAKNKDLQNQLNVDVLRIMGKHTEAEVLAVQNKYASMIENHAAYGRTRKEMEAILASEINKIYSDADLARLQKLKQHYDEVQTLSEEALEKKKEIIQKEIDLLEAMSNKTKEQMDKLNQLLEIMVAISAKQQETAFEKHLKIMNAFKDVVGELSDALKTMANTSEEDSKKYFKVYKAVAKAEAVIATYTAAAKALKDYPGWAGIAMAALITAKGLMDVANINKEQPAYAKGGVFSNSVVDQPTQFNASLMGEAGPEAIMPLTRGKDGKLGVQSSGDSSNSGPPTINNYYQVTAMDAQSVSEVLRRNPNAITAVMNQEMQRGNSALNTNIRRVSR